MKVCFLVFGMGSGGAERTISYLSEWGVANGHIVDLVIYGGSQNFYKLDSRINVVYVNPDAKYCGVYSKFQLIKRYKRKHFITKRIKEYVDKNSPDLIFCILNESIQYVLPISKKIPIVSSERSNPEWIESRIRRLIRNYLFNRTQGIIYQTSRVKDYYNNIVKIPNVVIPNAAGNPIIQEVTYNEAKTINKISAVGSLKEVKGYKTLILAFKIFEDSHPGYLLEIFGKGQDEALLKNLCKELNIETKVQFKGADPKALKYISNAKCYVLSSRLEGMPNALMEAMAIGMPCVSTNCDYGPAELIENNKSGLLVPVCDVEKMSEAISKMVDDRDFALRCGKEAGKLKNTNSVDVISKKYFEFFEKIVKQRKEK